MFEMIDEERDTGSSKIFWVKLGVFVAALAAMGGIIYFFAFLPYSH